MRSITNRSSGDRTTEIRRRAEWVSRGRTVNAYTATQESYTSIVAGRISAAIDECCRITVDDDVYVVGYFSGNPLNIYDLNNIVDISMSLISLGTRTMYLVRYSQSGYPLWAAKMGNTGQNLFAPSVTVDTNGDIYVSARGALTQINLFNAGSPTTNISLSLDTNAEKVWLAKYDSNGTVQWVTYMSYNPGTLSSNIPIYLYVDTNHNVYIFNDYLKTNGLVVYETNNTVPVKTFPPSSFGRNIALVKYDPNGKFIWASNISSTQTCQANSILCDKNNNVYIAGVYGNPLDIYNSDDSLSTTLISSGSFDSFLIKYNNAGTVQWTTHIGGLGQESRPSICVDVYQNIYMASETFSNQTYIYSYNVTPASFTITNTGVSTTNSDICLVKYNSSGIAQWVSKISGANVDRYPVVSADTFNNIILTGISRSSSFSIFSSSNLVSPALTITPTSVSSTNSCVFLISYNSSGTVNWGTRIENTNIAVIFPNITIDQFGNIYITSDFESNTTLQIYDTGTNVPVRTLTGGTASRSSFIVKYSNTGISTWAAKIGQYSFTPSISTPYKAAFS